MPSGAGKPNTGPGWSNTGLLVVTVIETVAAGLERHGVTKIVLDPVAEVMKIHDDLGDPVVSKETQIPDDQRLLSDGQEWLGNGVGEGP